MEDRLGSVVSGSRTGPEGRGGGLVERKGQAFGCLGVPGERVRRWGRLV